MVPGPAYDIEVDCADPALPPGATSELTASSQRIVGTLCLAPNTTGWGNPPIGGPFVKPDFAAIASTTLGNGSGVKYDAGLTKVWSIFPQLDIFLYGIRHYH